MQKHARVAAAGQNMQIEMEPLAQSNYLFMLQGQWNFSLSRFIKGKKFNFWRNSISSRLIERIKSLLVKAESCMHTLSIAYG